MRVEIETADRPCPECGQPLQFFTLSEAFENWQPITIVGCPACGIGNPPAVAPEPVAHTNSA